MKFIYKSNTSPIDQDLFIEYSKKFKLIKEFKDIERVYNQFNSDITLFLEGTDVDIIEKIKDMKLKRKIRIVTTDILLPHKLNGYVQHFNVLDDVTMTMSSLWSSPVTEYNNIKILRSLDIKPINLTSHFNNFSVYKKMELTENTFNGQKYIYYKLVDIDINYELKRIKKDKKAREKLLEKYSKGQLKSEKKTFKINKKAGVNNPYNNVSPTLIDLLIERGYTTEEVSKVLTEDYEKIDNSNLTLEEYMCNQKCFSKEDFTYAVSEFLNKKLISKTELSYYIPEFRLVTKQLFEKGVIEAYTIDDKEKKNPILIIKYTDEDELRPILDRTVNYSQIKLCIPQYFKEYYEYSCGVFRKREELELQSQEDNKVIHAIAQKYGNSRISS